LDEKDCDVQLNLACETAFNCYIHCIRSKWQYDDAVEELQKAKTLIYQLWLDNKRAKNKNLNVISNECSNNVFAVCTPFKRTTSGQLTLNNNDSKQTRPAEPAEPVVLTVSKIFSSEKSSGIFHQNFTTGRWSLYTERGQCCSCGVFHPFAGLQHINSYLR
jgi:hypothetical protein